VTSHAPDSAVITNIDNVRIEALPTNQPPSVTLTTPNDGELFVTPASMTISADASDPDGAVSRVDFYQNSTLIASDTDAPFTIDWQNAPEGWYSLTAVAVDSAGATASRRW
jgi:chitinase